MSYTVAYLPSAVDDLQETVRYIAHTLGNPSAAQKFSEELIYQVGMLSDFPYSAPAYTPLRPLKHEYRRLLVKNYFVFYWVDEDTKTVTVARIIYARRNIGSVFDNHLGPADA